MKSKFSFILALLCTIGNTLLAQSEEAPPPADQGFWQTLVMLGIFIVFFYLLLWRPEQKKRKALEEQRSTLKKGDRVVAMGILGNVVRVTDQSVILKMFDGSKIEVLKGAITDVIPESEETKKEEIDLEE